MQAAAIGAKSLGTPLPEKVGSYVIKGLLGEGGQGIVYEAEQQSPQRSVALKVLKGGRFVAEQDIRHFERESQPLAALNQPGIATIYEAGRTEEGQHFFAMELVADKRVIKVFLASPGDLAVERRAALRCAGLRPPPSDPRELARTSHRGERLERFERPRRRIGRDDGASCRQWQARSYSKAASGPLEAQKRWSARTGAAASFELCTRMVWGKPARSTTHPDRTQLNQMVVYLFEQALVGIAFGQ